MPTFTVKAPDGRTFKVNAPKGATPAQAVAYAPTTFSAAPKRTAIQTVADFGRDVIDNVLPNWGDEAYGRGQQLGANLGLNDRNPETAYEDGKRDFKKTQAQYDKEHPALAWTSTIAGTGAAVALPVGKIPIAVRGAQALSRAAKVKKVAKVAAVGAGYGAASGAGEGEGLEQRSVNALKGAGIGGTVGALIPGATNLAQKGGRFIRANVPGVDPAINAVGNAVRRPLGLPPVPPSARPQATADRMLADRMGQGNIVTGPGQRGAPASPTAIADQVEHRASIGVPAMPADTTEAMRKVTSWASRGLGPGQTRVREALAARKASEGSRVRQHVTDTMGPAVDPIAAVADNLAASKAAAAPLYREAYELPTQITPEMARIMETPAFREAVPQAVRNIENDMGDPRTMGFIPQADGSFLSPAEGVLTTEGFDQVQRAMRGAADKAGDRNPLTGQISHNTDSVKMNARAVDLQNQLRQQNAPLDEAITGYADEAAHRTAMQAGGDVSKLTGHEVNAQARALPADAHPSFAQGARTALADQASTYGAKFPMGDTAAAVNKSLGDPTKQAAIEAIDGGRGAVPALQQRLEAERQGNMVAKDVLGGPGTAEKLALDGEMNDDISKRYTPLTVPGMARAAWDFISEKAATPYRNAVKERIAQVVTETNPQTVRELMAEIGQRAQTDAEFADLMTKSGVFSAKLYGLNIKADEAE